MNAHSVDFKSQPAAAVSGRGRARVQAVAIESGVEVVVLREQRDRKGRLLAEAGTRGRAVEPLRGDCWLVLYEPTLQIWPTPLGDLRPAPERPGQGLQFHRLLGVLRMLVRLLRVNGCTQEEGAGVDTEVLAIIEYLSSGAPLPEALESTFGVFFVECPCGESGVCHRCDGKSKRCRACAGSAVCPLCPRRAEAHEKLAACLGVRGSSEIPQKQRQRRCRGSLLSRAA